MYGIIKVSDALSDPTRPWAHCAASAPTFFWAEQAETPPRQLKDCCGSAYASLNQVKFSPGVERQLSVDRLALCLSRGIPSGNVAFGSLV